MIDLVIGFFLVGVMLIVPGYFLCLGLFPSKEEIDFAERIAYSFMFSIILVPLVVLIENQVFGIAFEYWAVLGTMVFVSVIGLLAYFARTDVIAMPEQFYKYFKKIEKGKEVELIPKL